jgi:hypothetical protein
VLRELQVKLINYPDMISGFLASFVWRFLLLFFLIVLSFPAVSGMFSLFVLFPPLPVPRPLPFWRPLFFSFPWLGLSPIEALSISVVVVAIAAL